MYGNRCGSGHGKMHGSMCGRGFLTNEEKIEFLKEYAQSLENETKGVKERIKELEKAS